jgi:hypothetical protein
MTLTISKVAKINAGKDRPITVFDFHKFSIESSNNFNMPRLSVKHYVSRRKHLIIIKDSYKAGKFV